MRVGYSTETEQTSQSGGNPNNKLRIAAGKQGVAWGRAPLRGDPSRLRGCLTGLTGSCRNLAGEVSLLQGDVSGIKGLVDERLVGDVSGLRGDITSVWGNATGLRGDVHELVQKGMLWLKNRPFNLEMFATRYRLAMEFLDNSGMPALIAFHAVLGAPLHWLTVRENAADAFIVGPLIQISRQFSGREIMKVAIPGNAEWHISQDTRLILTDRVYALEHIEPLSSSTN